MSLKINPCLKNYISVFKAQVTGNYHLSIYQISITVKYEIDSQALTNSILIQKSRYCHIVDT